MMNELPFKTKKCIATAFLALLTILSLYFVVKFVNEVHAGRYIGTNSSQVNTIQVQGTGKVDAVPNIATVSFTIREEGKTSADAQAKATAKEKGALDFLANSNIDKKDVKTENTNTNPKYESGPQIVCIAYPCPSPKQTIVGYEVSETVSVKIRTVEDTGKITAGLAAIGISEINGPNYTLDEDEKYTDEARSKAIDDAKEKAEVLARQLGVRIVRVVSFNENGGGYPIYYAKDAVSNQAASAPAAPELPTGQNTLTSNVTITYEIK